jgi:hypothetical protein
MTGDSYLNNTIPTELGHLTSLTALYLGKIDRHCVCFCCTCNGGDWRTHVAILCCNRHHDVLRRLKWQIPTTSMGKSQRDLEDWSVSLFCTLVRLMEIVFVIVALVLVGIAWLMLLFDVVTDDTIMCCDDSNDRFQPTHCYDPNGVRTSYQSQSFGSWWDWWNVCLLLFH